MKRALPIALAVMLAVLQYRLWVGPGSLADVQRMRQHIAAVEADIQQTEARNAAMQATIDGLKAGDVDAIEARARQQLGLVREGEEFFVVLERP